MSVYVDDGRNGFGRMVMSHMIADTTNELLAMADMIELDRQWLQSAGTYKEHFDVYQSKRLLAIECGALPISQKDLARKVLGRRS